MVVWYELVKTNVSVCGLLAHVAVTSVKHHQFNVVGDMGETYANIVKLDIDQTRSFRLGFDDGQFCMQQKNITSQERTQEVWTLDHVATFSRYDE